MPIDTFFKFPGAVAVLMTVAHVLGLLFLTLVVANLLIGEPDKTRVTPSCCAATPPPQLRHQIACVLYSTSLRRLGRVGS